MCCCCSEGGCQPAGAGGGHNKGRQLWVGPKLSTGELARGWLKHSCK